MFTDFGSSPPRDWGKQELRLNYAITQTNLGTTKQFKLDNWMKASKRTPSFQIKHNKPRLMDDQTIIYQRQSTIAREFLQRSTRWKVAKTSKHLNKATRVQNCSRNARQGDMKPPRPRHHDSKHKFKAIQRQSVCWREAMIKDIRENKTAINNFVVRLHTSWKVQQEKKRVTTRTQLSH